jgi:two-component system, OmpR family, response regulator protein BraR/BceR
VLTVKIQAIIRRCYDFGANNSVLEHNGAKLNISDATITYDDKRLELTKNELKILQTLFDNKERIVSRSLLMEKLWESDAYVDENTLSVNVNRLRKKLDSIGLESFIVTWQKAEAIISVAHPDFRDELIKEAEKMHIWRKSNK